jgi:hypothetical protein
VPGRLSSNSSCLEEPTRKFPTRSWHVDCLQVPARYRFPTTMPTANGLHSIPGPVLVHLFRDGPRPCNAGIRVPSSRSGTHPRTLPMLTTSHQPIQVSRIRSCEYWVKLLCESTHVVSQNVQRGHISEMDLWACCPLTPERMRKQKYFEVPVWLMQWLITQRTGSSDRITSRW